MDVLVMTGENFRSTHLQGRFSFYEIKNTQKLYTVEGVKQGPVTFQSARAPLHSLKSRLESASG